MGISKDLGLPTTEFMGASDRKKLVSLVKQQLQTAGALKRTERALEDAKKLGQSPHEGLEERHRELKIVLDFLQERILEHGTRIPFLDVLEDGCLTVSSATRSRILRFKNEDNDNRTRHDCRYGGSWWTLFEGVF